mmetsp:Transcript_30191/g.66187  ORF Transcript_30191/g.66187 Transcript_30191/m.66187 type:complete len:278 (+) Transcript_30191:251-1084(+)
MPSCVLRLAKAEKEVVLAEGRSSSCVDDSEYMGRQLFSAASPNAEYVRPSCALSWYLVSVNEVHVRMLPSKTKLLQVRWPFLRASRRSLANRTEAFRLGSVVGCIAKATEERADVTGSECTLAFRADGLRSARESPWSSSWRSAGSRRGAESRSPALSRPSESLVIAKAMVPLLIAFSIAAAFTAESLVKSSPWSACAELSAVAAPSALDVLEPSLASEAFKSAAGWSSAPEWESTASSAFLGLPSRSAYSRQVRVLCSLKGGNLRSFSNFLELEGV